MKNASGFIGVIAGLFVVIVTGGVQAQDSPQWRGANHDGKVAGFTAPQAWPKALTQKWKVAVGAGDSTPALVGDKLYVFTRQGEEEVTTCLDAASGKELWHDKYTAQAVGGPAARGHAGPRSSPAVADGKVVTIGVGGVLTCLDAASGKRLWQKDEFPKVVPKFYAASSPIIVDGMVIAQLGGEGNGAIMAFDLSSGAVKWKWGEEGPGYASPVLLTIEGVKQVVALTEKSVIGVGLSDGKLLWKIAFAPQGMSYNSSTPIVDGQVVYVSGQGRGTKAIKVEKQGDGFAAKELWSNDKVAMQFASAVLQDGLLFGLSDKGNLFCIKAASGEEAWNKSEMTGRGGGFAGILDAGSAILALPSNSQLIAFKPDGKEYTEIARFKVAETPTYAAPVIAGNRVFIKDQDALILLTID
jgi:outer membrane protein assembly factor BamB